MQERYLFRGKRLDNGEFIKGNLVHGIFFKGEAKENIPYIMTGDFIDYDCFEDFSDDYGYYEVDPATVGQCTGLHAAKSYRGESEADRLVWEADAVKDEHGNIGVVIWDAGRGMWAVSHDDEGEEITSALFHVADCLEIIGNVHDNPELLREDAGGRVNDGERAISALSS